MKTGGVAPKQMIAELRYCLLLQRSGHGYIFEVEVAGRHEKFQTHLNRNLHIRHIFFVSVAIPVVKIVYNLLEYMCTRAC